MNIKLETINEEYKDYKYEEKIKDKRIYEKYLKESKSLTKEERTKLWHKYKKPYIDIDGQYRKKDKSFYVNLCDYLNLQEERFIKKDKWNYEFIRNKWIIAKSKDKELYLRSDIFGFSAPQVKKKDNRYPYTHYLNIGGKGETVASIVWNTRSLGGSFLWPVIKTNEQYRSLFNINRGVKSYIYDRVDLTLFEIKYFYKQLENNKPFKRIQENMRNNGFILLKDEDAKEIYEWLKHFKTFKTYIEYFSFQDFVYNEEIINIVNGNKIVNPHDKKEIPPIKNLSKNELENMLININNMSIKRTTRMADCIKNNQKIV